MKRTVLLVSNSYFDISISVGDFNIIIMNYKQVLGGPDIIGFFDSMVNETVLKRTLK